MGQQFDASSIKPVQWGAVRQLPTGHWITTWQIELVAADPIRLPEIEEAARDDAAGFAPRLVLREPHALDAEIETVHRAMELDYYELTYRLFVMIDSRVGRIRSIQGSPRDWWQPFRNAKQDDER